MKRIVVSFLSLLVVVSFAWNVQAQKESGNGNVVEVEKQVPSFNAVEIDGTLEVKLTQGESQKVVVKLDGNLQENVKAVVKGETLTFEIEKLRKPSEFEIIITFKEFKQLKASGAAEVESMGTLSSEQLTIITSGATEVELNLDVQNLEINSSGASELKLEGSANMLNAMVSGAAELKANNLVSKVAVIKTSGAASATMKVEEEVRGNSSGASEIKVLGDPKVKMITEEGAGSSKVYNNNGVKVRSTNYGDSTMVRVGELNIEVIDGDTTYVRVGGSRIEVDGEGNVEFTQERKHRFDGHWGGFDLGVNYYLNADNEMKLPEEYKYLDLAGKSMNVHLNIYEQNFNLINNHFGLITGIGFEYTNYRFEDDVILIEGEDGIAREEIEENDERNYLKSKLVVNHLNVPLLLEYQTNRFSKTNSFHITFGVIGSLRIGSHTKTIWDDGGEDKNKVKDDFHLNPFKVESTVRIGWSKLNLYANYSLLPLFEDEKGPELYPFSMGLTLLSW